MANSLKEKVLAATDIVDVIGERVSLTRKGKEFVGLCPFHNDHRPSMHVVPAKQIFKCFSCGAGGDAIRFIELSNRVDFREALRILAQRAGIELNEHAKAPPATNREPLQRALEWARSRFQKNLAHPQGGASAREYAAKRGLSPQTIERFGIGLALDGWHDLRAAAEQVRIPADVLLDVGLIVNSEKGNTYDRFRHRLMFPICDGQGRMVGFGGRTLGDDPAKYLNSPETPLFSKSRILYGLDQARAEIQKTRQVVVVEGYMDAVLLHQHGFCETVATLGTALTDAHMKLLAQLAERVYLCFDNDEAGQRAADRAVETALRHRLDVRVAIMPHGQDPADCILVSGADGFRSKLHSAVGALEFKWLGTVAAYSSRGNAGQREAVNAYMTFIARVAAAGGIGPVEQGLLVSRVGELLSIPADVIYDALAAERRRIGRRSVAADAGGTSERSLYAQSTAALPAGLVASAEELCGIVLNAPERYEQLHGALAMIAVRNEVWGRLEKLVADDAERDVVPDRERILSGCDDAAVWELVSRACRRMRGREITDALCTSVTDRIAAELALLRVEHLRSGLVRTADGPQGDAAFRTLLEVTRRQRGGFSVKHRMSAPPGAGAPSAG